MARFQIEQEEACADLSGPQALVAGLFRATISDCRQPARPHTARWHRREAARAWLKNERLVGCWLDLVWLPRTIYPRLLAEAGLEEDAPCP